MGDDYVDTSTGGVPNLHPFAPGMWRTGHPPDSAAWDSLTKMVTVEGKHTVMVQLHDDVEGDDAPDCARLGWTLVKVPLPPEDDKPWTVFELPRKQDVDRAVDSILKFRADGFTVVWGCVHGRDRTGLISAIVGMRLLGWSKDQAWQNMLENGFRWELPDLDIYWLTDVPG